MFSTDHTYAGSSANPSTHADEDITATCSEAVREFITIISQQAQHALRNSDRPGLLQLFRIHPDDGRPAPTRFAIDDIEGMTRAAINDSRNGHNVYIEGRTVRSDLRGSERGKIEDTAWVFALVIDSDADKGMESTLTLEPSLEIETSPGNRHQWLFLDQAISADEAKVLGERIRAAVHADHDTGNVVQPYRVAGTVNYPSARKRERGRTITPTRIISHSDRRYTLAQLEEAFPARKTNGAAGTKKQGQPKQEQTGEIDVGVLMAMLSEADRKLIRTPPEPNDDRSRIAASVMWRMMSAGISDVGIRAVFEEHPHGIGQRYSAETLGTDIARQRQKYTRKHQENHERIFSAADLQMMVMEPIEYVVPEYIPEGLTLFCGKPKIGKSWLLLHVASAIADGGETLGVKCDKGNVLYCALEDNKRRLRNRMDKLLSLFRQWPERLDFRTSMPRLADGGLDFIREWLKTVERPRLVIIDTLAVVRMPNRRDQTNYDADYDAVRGLRDLAAEYKVGIVLVHHLRKAEADDPFDTISGTLGLTGAADTIAILRRENTGVVFLAQGRDIEAVRKAISFDPDTCTWDVIGDADEVKRSVERSNIIQVLKDEGEPLGPGQIATALGMPIANVRMLLSRMMRDDMVKKAGRGKYQLVK